MLFLREYDSCPLDSPQPIGLSFALCSAKISYLIANSWHFAINYLALLCISAIVFRVTDTLSSIESFPVGL